MDKGLEKINGLTSKMNELEQNMAIVSNERVTKTRELLFLRAEGEKLKQEKRNINNDILNYEYKQKNIKKWKWQTIIKTTAYFLGSMVILGMGYSLIIENIVDIGIQILSVLTGLIMLPVSVMMGESNDYYRVKKYLASHSIEEFEGKLQNYIKEIELNNQKQDSVSEVLKKIYNAKEEMEHSIEEYRLEIEKIENIRAGVINSYLNNNQELDNLLDESYKELYENQKKKELVMENNA